MSKIIPIQLENHYKQQNTTIAKICKLTLRNGKKLGFTSFDKDIIFEDEPDLVYKAFNGMTPSAIVSSTDYSPDNLEVEGFINSEEITETKIKLGEFDYADVVFGAINWNDKPYNWTKVDILRVGKTAEIRIENGKFIAEIFGLMNELNKNVGPLYQSTCRAMLGDNKCKVNLDNYKYPGSVLGVIENIKFDTTLTNPDNHFNNGVVVFLTGENAGMSYEVKSFLDAIVELQIPANFTISSGDTFEIYRGCDRTIKTCQDVFGNAINFRGEPYIPNSGDVVNNS